jgi:hypothetical protein
MLYDDLRQSLAVASNLKQIDAVIIEMQKRCQMQHAEYLLAPKSVNTGVFNCFLFFMQVILSTTGSLLFPHWICQPYFRPLPKVKDDEEDDDETVEKSSKPKKPVSELDQAIVMRLQHRKRKTDVIDKLSNVRIICHNFFLFSKIFEVVRFIEKVGAQIGTSRRQRHGLISDGRRITPHQRRMSTKA